MRRSSLIAAVAAFGLVAAANPAPPAHGTAESKMSALEVTVSGLPVPGEISMLDVVSFASTDTDESRNPKGAPYSIISAIPAIIAGQSVGAVSARSDGDNESSGQGLTQAVGPLSASVGALDLRATADQLQALAVLDAANAHVGALAGALDLDVRDVGLSSKVTQDAASAVQGIRSDGLNLQLGDLLPLDDLPLDVVIGLAQQLTGVLSGTVGELLDRVGQLYEQLGTMVTKLETQKAAYIESGEALEDTLQAIEETEEDIAAIEAALADATSLLGTGTEDDIQKVIDEGSQLIGEVTGVVSNGDSLITLQYSANDALTDLIDDLNETKTELEGEILELESTVETLVDDLIETLAEIVDLSELLDGVADQLLTAVQDLLAQLPSVLDALADADLVDIGAMDVGISAVASGSDAKAVLGCAVEQVRVVGLDLGKPSCAEPLINGSAGLADAISTLKGVLGELPIVGGVVPEITLSVFSNAHERVGEKDGYRFAEAGVDLLEFELPSIELGDLTDGLLDGLLDGDLSDLIGSLGDLLGADLSGSLGGIDAELDAALDGALSTLTGVVSEIIDIETVLGDIIATLPATDALNGLSTPGIKVKIDPTSRAEFRAGAIGSTPAAPEDGSPTGAPSLPTTGGGLGVLGLLGVLGATALRRRT